MHICIKLVIQNILNWTKSEWMWKNCILQTLRFAMIQTIPWNIPKKYQWFSFSIQKWREKYTRVFQLNNKKKLSLRTLKIGDRMIAHNDFMLTIHYELIAPEKKQSKSNTEIIKISITQFSQYNQLRNEKSNCIVTVFFFFFFFCSLFVFVLQIKEKHRRLANLKKYILRGFFSTVFRQWLPCLQQAGVSMYNQLNINENQRTKQKLLKLHGCSQNNSLFAEVFLLILSFFLLISLFLIRFLFSTHT